MAVQNIEVTTESILCAVVRLPENEVDKLFKDAKRLKKRQTELITKIKNIDLLPEDQKIYGKLLKKFRAEKITSEEHKKLIEFNEELENIGVQRLEWLIEISQMRQQPLEEIMKELDIKPKNYG
ncbi:MAG: hypothetical protein ACR2J3_13840 [Aridibacter sp.]